MDSVCGWMEETGSLFRSFMGNLVENIYWED